MGVRIEGPLEIPKDVVRVHDARFPEIVATGAGNAVVPIVNITCLKSLEESVVGVHCRQFFEAVCLCTNPDIGIAKLQHYLFDSHGDAA